MKKVIMVCVLLFAFLYVSIGCEDKKGGSYTLTGTVSNVMRQAMAGRTLKCITFYEDLRIENDTLVTTLGANGDFTFRGLDFGNYQLVLVPLDTMDFFRTFTDTLGVATRKAVYSNGRFIGGIIGMARNEVLNDTVLSSGVTAVKIKGKVSAYDTLVRPSTGVLDSIVNRSGGATISFSQFPGKNWSNPVFLSTSNDTGSFEKAGIPRVNIVSNAQVPFIFNCRIDRAGFQPVEIDSIVGNHSEIDLGTIQLLKQ